MNEFEDLALVAAAKSPCEKRKVGAIFANGNVILASGCNYNTEPGPCECASGGTYDTVVHAEIATLNKVAINRLVEGSQYNIYVTHEPCRACEDYINAYAKTNRILITVSVVEQFMKFDSGKLAYDLIPSEWIEGLAEVLTKGAQKYKPNNWKEIKPEEIMRYYAACERHLQEWRKFMEGKDVSLFDDGELGIGTHHLMNAMTNLGFLLTLTETEEKANVIREQRNS